MRPLLLLTLALLLSPYTFSQSDSSPSLGDVARHSREAHKPADAAPPKKVLDNEDLEKSQGPIPDISLTKAENAPEIIEAIVVYSKTHTDQETETAVRQWYDDEIHIVRAAVEHTVTLYQDRVSPTNANALDRQREFEDYRQYREMQNDTQQRDINDLKTLADFQAVVNRIMFTLNEVKNGIRMQKRYDFAWFDTTYPQTRLIFMPNRPGYYQ